MSLASPYQEQYYVADGVTTSFAFGQGFTALNEIDIKCIIYFEDGTDCIPVFNVNTTTGYINIVTLTKPDGTVLTAPPAGSIVRIFRDTPEQQNVTASQLQNYTAKQLERIFDSIVAMIQEVSYSDQHKTIRLTETQRDIAIDYLPNDKDQAVIYWDMESRKLMPADFGQNQVVKSDGIEWLVYNQSEGKIYYVPREGGNPIPIGKATIHNDLSGRNAPDCHPESAITGLTTHLQELRDADTALAEDVQTALNRSQEAKDTADEAKDTAEYAQTIAGQAKDIAEDAKETAEGIEGIAEEAKGIAQDAKDIAQDAKEIAEGVEDIAQDALDKITQEITDREDADSALQDQITINKGTMDNHIADTNNPHQVTKIQVGLGNVDNTSDLDKPISTATQTALDGKVDKNADITGATKCKITYDNKGLVTAGADLLEIDIPLLHLSKISDVTASASEINVLDGITASTTELNYVDGVTSAIQTQIDGKQPKSASAYNMGNTSGGWTAMSNTQQAALNSGANTTNIGQIATNTSNIANEIIDRQNADNGLQSQIDALVSKSDVVDIVGTYAELQAYDTSGLDNNDVVKVISDSTHNNAPSYYRWVITGGVGAWVYIGSESETYTKAETDALLNAKQDNITATDGITLTGTTLTNSGVRAVASGTTNGTISVNTNGTSADVSVTGLGSAAYTSSSDYATSAQGGKADTAVQPSDLATVATTGQYSDLIGKPTIPAAQVNSDWNAVSGVAQILNKPTLGTMAAESANDYVAKSGDTMTGSLTLYTNPGSGLTTNLTFLDKYNHGIDLFQDAETLKVHLHTTNETILFPTTSGTLALTSDIPVTDVTVGGTSVVSSGVAAVPAIPTVNNPTITITQGGVTKGSFTLNQATGDTIALDAGGGSDSSYHPDLFDVKWADHILNDVQWLRADTFSWQSGAVYQVAYQHLADDITGKTLQSETISGTTIQFYLADDGHKICPASEESNVSAIYAATGVAWYYIIDTANTRFKLPRRHSQQIIRSVKNTDGSWYRLYADGWVEQGGIARVTTNGLGTTITMPVEMSNIKYTIVAGKCVGDTGSVGFNIEPYTTTTFRAGVAYSGNLTRDFSWQASGQSAIDTTSFQNGEKYLYFYVGNFTQTALENTAGLNAELFNGKADLNLANVLANIDFVVESQEPTAGNGYTWYRKYRSGWVEQGGETTNTANSVVLPVEMADNHYVILRNFEGGGVQSQYPMWVAGYTSKTTTGFTFTVYSPVNVWYVCGKAAN